MLKIESIEFKNLLSYGNEVTTINFEDFNNLLIYGKNGNGKSTLIEAIHFNLFGKPYRDKITINKLISKHNGSKLWTKLTFESNGNKYILERGLKPTILSLTKNGDPIKEGVSKNYFQEEIDKIIGLNYKLFNQLGLVDNQFHKPFMSLGLQDKKLIIDKLFGLDTITDMHVLSKTYRNKINNKVIESQSGVELVKEKIKINENLRNENREKELKEFNDKKIEHSKSIKENDVQIALLQDKELDFEEPIKKLENEKNKINESGMEVFKLQHESEMKIFEIKNNITKNNELITTIDEGKLVTINPELYSEKVAIEKNIEMNEDKIKDFNSGVCPTCKRDWPDAKSKIDEITGIIKAEKNKLSDIKQKISNELGIKKKEIQDEIIAQEQEIKVKNKTLEEIGSKVLEITKELEEFDNRIKEEKNKRDEIKVNMNTLVNKNTMLNNEIETLTANIKKLEEDNIDNDAEIKKLKDELNQKENQVMQDQTMLGHMKTIETILNKDLRYYIIDRYLPLLNQKLSYYLDLMEANFYFKLGSDFNEVEDDSIRNSFSYGSLSGGQKARVNMAVLFSFIEFAEKRNNTKFDFILVDELLDSFGLDTEGKESVIDILTQRINKKLILISHDESIKEFFDHSIKVEKKGQFSKLIWN